MAGEAFNLDKLCFRDGLLWTVGLTVAINLRFHILVWTGRKNFSVILTANAAVRAGEIYRHLYGNLKMQVLAFQHGCALKNLSR